MHKIHHHRVLAAEGDGGGGGGDGSPPPAFYSDANKEFVTGKGWKSGDDVITSYRNLETLHGADKAGRTVVLPKDDKDADGLKAFRAKLGVPDAHTGYKIPDAMKDDPTIGKFAEVLHSVNVPGAAFGKIMSFLQEHAAASTQAEEAAATEAANKAKADSQKALDGLKGEWGNDFDTNSEFARRGMKEIGYTDEQITKYEETFGTAQMLKTFHAVGKKTGELNYEGGSGSGFSGTTATQARAKLDEYNMKRATGEITDLRWNELQPEMDKLRIAASPKAA